MEPIVAGLRAAWAGVFELVADPSGDDWQRSTPCHPWTVHDLVAHLGHLEGTLLHGFPQPDPPDGWSFEGEGLHRLTNAGVAARRPWSHTRVVDETRRAGQATLELLEGLDEQGWQREIQVEIFGRLTMGQVMELRLGDIYVHLLDLRTALGRPISAVDEPEAVAPLVARAVRLAGWAAVKQAGLPEGTRVLLELSGPGATSFDVTVEGGRGRVGRPQGRPDAAVSGPGLAFVLAAGGRPSMAQAAGGLRVEGDAAHRLLERFGLFG
ncbi:MAG: maleylpyruvate isomerase family mycothiol-dependent enzyme [Acidimicrobiia bacterium]